MGTLMSGPDRRRRAQWLSSSMDTSLHKSLTTPHSPLLFPHFLSNDPSLLAGLFGPEVRTSRPSAADFTQYPRPGVSVLTPLYPALNSKNRVRRIPPGI